jgi:hypothetical protein
MTTIEPENARAGHGAVVLDIGGDVGALVVAMPNAMVGREVEIRPRDGQHVHPHAHGQGQVHGPEEGHGHDHGRLAHVAVIERPVQGGRVPSLVFGELPSGRYELFEKGRGDVVALHVVVSGGEVVTASWPGAA